jgi:hypothetical protein
MVLLMSQPTGERNMLLLLTAALFAVRLFRAEQDVTPLGASPETQAKIQEWEQIDREDTARRAAADAAAIMAAVSVVKL